MKSCFVFMGVFKIGRVLYTKRKFSSCSALEPLWGEIFSEVEVFLFFHRPVFSRDNYEEFMTVKAHVF